MGLYSNYQNDYEDDFDVGFKPKKAEPQNAEVKREIKLPESLLFEPKHELYTDKTDISVVVPKKSLYDDTIRRDEKPKSPRFDLNYRVGQRVKIYDLDGSLITSNGVVSEIPAPNVMYVLMHDTYKDVHGNFLVTMVTEAQTVVKI